MLDYVNCCGINQAVFLNSYFTIVYLSVKMINGKILFYLNNKTEMNVNRCIYNFVYCQARLLLLFAQKLQIQLNSEKKEQSWRYNPNAPTHPPPTPNFLKLVEGWFSLSFSSQLYEKYFHDFLNEFPIDFSIHFSDKFSNDFSNDFSNVYVLNILFLSKSTQLELDSKVLLLIIY